MHRKAIESKNGKINVDLLLDLYFYLSVISFIK